MSKSLKYILLAIASAYTACFLLLGFLRIRYPFELEWMEGGSVVQIARILSGGRLYVTPQADFVPYIYPPLYFYLSALVAKLTGIGFAPIRIVSLASSIGSIALIHLFVKTETKDRFAGWIAACLFAATYHISGAWMDIARVDPLLVFLLVLSFYVLRFGKGLPSRIVSGAIFTLAFLTKQTAILMVLPTILLVLVIDRRRSASFAVSAIVFSCAAYLALDRLHGGFYSYYTTYLPRQQAAISEYVIPKYIVSFWTIDFALPLAIAIGLSILYFYIQNVRGRREAFLFYICFAIGMIGGAWVARIHRGSYLNVLIPAYAVSAILFGLGLHEARELVRRSVLRPYPFAGAFLSILCIIQFAALAYNPLDQIPSMADRRAGEKLIERISRIEGDVLIPFHPWYAAMAGKQGCAQHMAIRDVMRAEDSPERRALIRDYEQKLRERRYAAIVLDNDELDFMEDVRRYYTGPDSIAPGGDDFFPVTGVQLRPAWIWWAHEADRE
jgi:4-amino-4-deoxy-L-arabinose transferase-like glycosyltransferase